MGMGRSSVWAESGSRKLNMKTTFRMGWPIVTCILGLYLCHVVYVQASMQCAHTLDGWSRGSVSLQCQEPKHYHCLPDEFGHFIQKCSNRILVPPGMCPRFNSESGQINVFECQSNQNSCPPNHFWSYDVQVLIYYGCYIRINPTTTEIAITSITKLPSTPLITHMTSKDYDNSTFSDNIYKKNPNSATTLALVIPIVLVMCVTILITGIIYHVRKRRHRGENGELENQSDNQTRQSLRVNEDREMSFRLLAKYYETGGYQLEPPLGKSEIPTGFQKTNDYLKSHVFTSSKFYEHAIGVLDVHRCITIVGPPGCGKTLTALQLASRKCGRGGKSQLYFCQTLEEVLTTAQENNGAYIIVDEFLDKYFYYPSTLDEAVESLNVICNELVIGKKIHLIITVQEDKWSIFQKSLKGCRLFNQPYLSTINSKTFSEMERQNMVRCHFNHFDIEESCGSKNDSIEEKKAVNYKGQIEMSANQAEYSGKEETDPLVKEKIAVNKGLIETPAKQAEDSVKEETRHLTGHLLKKKTFVQEGTIYTLAKKIKDEKEFSFPVVVDLICTNKRLQMAMNLVLDDGLTTTLKYFFDNWSNDKDIKENRSFCILVLAALLGGEISPRNLSGHVTGPVFKRICSEFKYQLDGSKNIENETEGKAKRNSNYECDELQSDEELFQTNLRLKSCLFRISRGQDDPLFVFQHNSLLRYVLVYVKKAKGENFFIENATMKVLLNNCWLEAGIIDQFLPGKEKTTLEPVGSVSLSTSAIKSLAKRIFSEVKDGYRIPDWEKHAFMKRTIFSDLWLKSTEAIQMQESGMNE